LSKILLPPLGQRVQKRTPEPKEEMSSFVLFCQGKLQSYLLHIKLGFWHQ
jgi:hypothetical protein